MSPLINVIKNKGRCWYIIRIWRIYKNKITTSRQIKESIFQDDEIALPGIYYLSFFYWFERMKGRERAMWERNIDQLPPTCTATRDQIRNLGICPDWESNLPHFCMWVHAPTSWATLGTVWLGFSWKKSHMTICFWLSCFLMVFKQPVTDNEFELFIRNYFPYL